MLGGGSCSGGRVFWKFPHLFRLRRNYEEISLCVVYNSPLWLSS